MQGDQEETVGIGGQRVSRRLWEAEIVLRGAAWVAGIHGATLLGLGILTDGFRIKVYSLPIRIVFMVAGAVLLGASALILGRRGRWAIFSVAALHLLCTLYLAAVFVMLIGAVGDMMGSVVAESFGSAQGGEAEKSAVDLFLSGARSLHVDQESLPYLCFAMLAILLPVFVASAVLGRPAKKAFSPALRGTPLASLSSCPKAGASVRAWAALAVVGLSLVHLVQILLLFRGTSRSG